MWDASYGDSVQFKRYIPESLAQEAEPVIKKTPTYLRPKLHVKDEKSLFYSQLARVNNSKCSGLVF